MSGCYGHGGTGTEWKCPGDESMSYGSNHERENQHGNGKTTILIRYVVVVGVAIGMLYVAPLIWRQYENAGDQTDRIAELKADKTALQDQLDEARDQISDLRMELRIAQQPPIGGPIFGDQSGPQIPTPGPSCCPLAPPTTADTTYPDRLDQLDQALSTLERIQEAQARLEKLVGQGVDLADDPAFIKLRSDLDAVIRWIWDVDRPLRQLQGAVKRLADDPTRRYILHEIPIPESPRGR